MKIAAEGQFHTDYLSKSNTTAINGIFVVLVFLCHFAQYVKFSPDFIDQSFVFFKSHLGQLVVTTFLFFSGYGIICSISKKGSDYIKSIPKKRFLSVLIHFDIAVILFMVVNVLLGKGFGQDSQRLRKPLLGELAIVFAALAVLVHLILYLLQHQAFPLFGLGVNALALRIFLERIFVGYNERDGIGVLIVV